MINGTLERAFFVAGFVFWILGQLLKWLFTMTCVSIIVMAFVVLLGGDIVQW